MGGSLGGTVLDPNTTSSLAKMLQAGIKGGAQSGAQAMQQQGQPQQGGGGNTIPGAGPSPIAVSPGFFQPQNVGQMNPNALYGGQ